MVINREFFFRGWLPAGLVINARLLTTVAPQSNLAVLKPMLNPVPGASWPSNQPQPIFPVDQATSEAAIVLADPFPDNTLAMLPLGEWLGPGTPYILAINTWYEGRIRMVAGGDVMAIRIMGQTDPKYYSYYSGMSDKDVSIRSMACHLIKGRSSEQVLAIDGNALTMSELGYPSKVDLDGVSVPSRVLDLLTLTRSSYAGMRAAYAEQNPGTESIFIQCVVAAGVLVGQSPKYVGLIPDATKGSQKFYLVSQGSIEQPVDEITGPGATIATVARSTESEQLVFSN